VAFGTREPMVDQLIGNVEMAALSSSLNPWSPAKASS
jgi:hypothetical protein